MVKIWNRNTLANPFFFPDIECGILYQPAKILPRIYFRMLAEESGILLVFQSQELFFNIFRFIP